MNRSILLITTLCVSLQASSCEETYKKPVELVKCDVSAEEIEFDVNPSESQTFTIESESSWKISVEQSNGSWCEVSPLEGTGTATITIKAAENKGPKRSAEIEVASKGAEVKTVSVIQAGFQGTTYNFQNLDGFNRAGMTEYNPVSFVESSECEDGWALRLYTRPGEEHMGPNGDRVKVKTVNQYGSGRYEWRIYVPVMGMNDRTSIGAFLYYDDYHELDFEICSGTAADRGSAGCGADDMLCKMTSQANPHVSNQIAVKGNAWHVFALDLQLVDKKYLVSWIVDDKTVASSQMSYGETDAYFKAISSVENLMGMGDHAATQENYALFDYLEYAPYDYSMKPVKPGELGPEPDGETVTFDFDDNLVPEGWVNNGGEFSDGYMWLPNGTNAVYTKTVGPGKYSFRISVPAVGEGEKWLSGLSLAGDVEAERSFSMMVWSGSKGVRDACDIVPAKGQMLVRCYTESLGAWNYPIDPGMHNFVLDLRLVNGCYSANWLVDGDLVKSFTTWYTPDMFNLGLSFRTFADGGGWQGSINTTQTYKSGFDSISVKLYDY